MLVYLLRVATVAAGEQHLSYEGRQAVRAVGNTIRLNDEPSFDRVVASSAPAAIQTAELFAERTDYLGVVEVMPLLAGPTPAEVAVPLLIARGEAILVIADEPLLATLGAFIVGRPTFPPALPGQVSVIEDRKPSWFLRPGEMKRTLLVA